MDNRSRRPFRPTRGFIEGMRMAVFPDPRVFPPEETLGEHNFNSDEPRDYWGRWTDGGSYDHSRSYHGRPNARAYAFPSGSSDEKGVKKLTWKDFKEVDVLPPHKGGGEDALVTVRWKNACTKTISPGLSSDRSKGKFTCTVTTKIAKITPQYECQVVKGSQTDELLAHENGHVAISENAARAAEREIQGVVGTATANNAGIAISRAIEGWNTKMDKVCQESFAVMNEAQEKYDKDTDHGQK